MNIIKKIMLSILLITATFGNLAFAEEQTTASNPKISEERNIIPNEEITVDESLINLTNRFVLSVFGSNAYILFEPHKILEPQNIIDLDDSAYKELSFPFSYLYMFMKYVFFTLLMLSYLFMFGFLIIYIINKFNKTNGNIDDLGKKHGKIFDIIKFVILLVLSYPLIFDNESMDINDFFLKKDTSDLKMPILNISQGLVLMNAGLSNYYGTNIITSISKNQPRTYTSIKYPRSESKMYDFEKMINFMMCVKTDDSIQETEIKFSSKLSDDNFTYYYETPNSQCQITLNFKIENNLSKIKVDDNDIQKYYLSLRDNEILTIKSFVESALNKASTAANILKLERPLQLPETRDTEVINLIYADRKNPVWEENCPNVWNFIPSSNNLSTLEKKQYAFLSARCLSYEFSKYFMYKNIEQTRFLKLNNVFKNRHQTLCDSNYNNLSDIKKLRKVSISDDVPNQVALNNSTFNVESYFSNTSIKDCVVEACSNINNGEFSNLYECSSSLSLYKEINDSHKIEKYGFFTIPAQINSFFKGFNNYSSQIIYNGFGLSESLQVNQDSNGKINENSLIIKIGTSNKENKFLIEKDNTKEIKNNYIFDDSNVEDLLKTIDFLGVDRFLTCVKSPLMVSNGYSCSSLTEEYHKIGNNLFYFGLQGKILLASASTIKDSFKDSIKSLKKNRNKTEGGDVSENEKSKIGIIVKAANIFFKNAVVPSTAAYFLSDSATLKANDFNELDSGYVNDILSSDIFRNSFIVLLGMVNFINSFMSPFFTAFIILGVLVGFIIPFLPLYIIIKLVIEWVFLFISNVIISLFIPLIMIKESKNHSNEGIMFFIKMHIILLFKIPFLIIGVFLSWIAVNTITSRILELFSYETILNINYGQSITGMIDFVVIFVIYAIVMYVITNMSLNIMNVIFDMSSNMIDGRETSTEKGVNESDPNRVLSEFKGVFKI